MSETLHRDDAGRRHLFPRRTSTRLLLAGVALAILVIAYLAISGNGGSGEGGPSGDTGTAAASLWTCPMHPEIVRDEHGSCPICGMDLVPVASPENQTSKADESTRFLCPMHPEITSDHPGSCPVCGMDLVPDVKRVSGHDESTVPGRATVTIGPEQRQRIGLRLGAVETRILTREVRTSARIVVDETRQAIVTTKIEGWVDKLYVATTGQAVKQGEPLLTVYSPELVSTQEEYLSALAAQAQLASGSQDTRQSGDFLVAAARRRLELWDISDEQINRLEKSGIVEKYLTLYAPFSGWVIERRVLPGQKVMSSEPLLVIADLNEVWADADIYQSDLPHVQLGMPAEISLPALPGRTLHGRVTFVTPTLDPETRTMRARLQVDNRELLLKPEMYATARLEHDIGDRLSVPTSAIIFTGTQSLAFQAGPDQRLIPVEVDLGDRSGDYYEVLSGLHEGDSVVISANFLIDSESSLRAARAALTKGKTGSASTGHEGH